VDETRRGFDLGVGLAWMFAPNWDLFVEYDHMWLGSKTVLFNANNLPFFETIKQDLNQVIAGVDYRFTWGRWGDRLAIAARNEYRLSSYQPDNLRLFVNGVAANLVSHQSVTAQTVTTALVWKFHWQPGSEGIRELRFRLRAARFGGPYPPNFAKQA
jgi:hypothetical protein